MTDPTTKAWIRNESDERAAAAGYRFDVSRAAYVVWWIENYCRLYEGEWAGEPMILRGCHEDLEGLPVTLSWDEGGKEESLLRAEIYAERFAAGEAVDWQYECTMRVFGWVGHSTRWGREVRRFRKSAVFVPKKSKKVLPWQHGAFTCWQGMESMDKRYFSEQRTAAKLATSPGSTQWKWSTKARTY